MSTRKMRAKAATQEAWQVSVGIKPVSMVFTTIVVGKTQLSVGKYIYASEWSDRSQRRHRVTYTALRCQRRSYSNVTARPIIFVPIEQ